MSKLDQLRATMASLESYELPARFLEDPVDKVLEDDTIQRYKVARDEYLHRRILQVFYDHIGTLEDGRFDLPPLPTREEQAQLQEKRAFVQQELLRTAAQVNQNNLALQSKYRAFCARREELGKMIHDLEQNPMSQDEDEGEVEPDLDQGEFTYQGQHLADLTQRKAELELELQRIRHEKTLAIKTLDETKTEVEELQKKRGAVMRAVSPETLEELELETNSIRSKVEELKEMSEWYSGICQVMEEISGIKLVSVEEGTGDEVVIKVQLLGKHVVHITMSNRGREFHVKGANFATSTLVRSSEDADATGSVQMNIPSLDDLVRLSVNLGSVEDLRFLLRETTMRIRTITARVNELAILRTRYLTKIGRLHSLDYSFGGQDQEIMCSLNECVTAVIRMAPDCPLEEDSARLEQLVGVGGWHTEILESIEKNIPHCKGPIQLMEVLMGEIRRLEENGMEVPKTPSMPSRKGN